MQIYFGYIEVGVVLCYVTPATTKVTGFRVCIGGSTAAAVKAITSTVCAQNSATESYHVKSNVTRPIMETYKDQFL